ncbi:MAG: YkgJ family cysteine cluster protein [Promethearchaeota archaeon]
MEYIKICKRCKQSICCSIPFFAFVNAKEYIKIKEFLDKKKIQVNWSKIFKKEIEPPCYLIVKNKNGECIFLQKNKTCKIHEVKPLDCQLWPLTFEFVSETKIVNLYLGNCLIIKELDNLNKLINWIASQKEFLIRNIISFNEIELIAYSSLPDIPKLKKIGQFQIH